MDLSNHRDCRLVALPTYGGSADPTRIRHTRHREMDAGACDSGSAPIYIGDGTRRCHNAGALQQIVFAKPLERVKGAQRTRASHATANPIESPVHP